LILELRGGRPHDLIGQPVRFQVLQFAAPTTRPARLARAVSSLPNSLPNGIEMTSKTLDDLPEPLLRRMTDHVTAGLYLTAGRYDHKIPYIVAHEWALTGRCVLSTNDLARRFNSTKRTMCLALKRLTRANVIREVGRTDDGRAIYVPCLERGDEWRSLRGAHAWRTLMVPLHS
jgi:hypothetical protein